ncbi:MAG: hypothetical protein WC623_15625 [Pedobacter sp.]|uniref:hypothetical protein n=1 Tax=Pedobacter sp. TaxID=1411316 RepID=UPI003568A195
MKLKSILSAVLLLTLLFSNISYAQKAQSISFSPNNLLVVRVGDGNSGLNADAAPVFLNEYTTTGSVVQSIPMPVSGRGSHGAFVLSGDNPSQGYSSFSANGQFVTLIGYDASPKTAASILKSISTPKVIALVSKRGLIPGRLNLMILSIPEQLLLQMEKIFGLQVRKKVLDISMPELINRKGLALLIRMLDVF